MISGQHRAQFRDAAKVFPPALGTYARFDDVDDHVHVRGRAWQGGAVLEGQEVHHLSADKGPVVAAAMEELE